jgi:hypothetical protein
LDAGDALGAYPCRRKGDNVEPLRGGARPGCDVREVGGASLFLFTLSFYTETCDMSADS